VTSEAHRMMPVVQRVMSVAQRVQPVAQLLKMYHSGIIPSSDFKSRNGPEISTVIEKNNINFCTGSWLHPFFLNHFPQGT
jgi:hypothetical protein